MTDSDYFALLSGCPLKCVGCEHASIEMGFMDEVMWVCLLDECILEEETPS